MGNMREEIVRSLKLNKDLAKMLKQGIELNKPIKIGWSEKVSQFLRKEKLV